MNLFETLEVNNYAKGYFSNLNPKKAPLYFILVAVSIAVVKSCKHLDGIFWYTYFIFLSFLILILIISASKTKVRENQENIIGEIRITRITGIAVALIGMSLITDSIKNSLEIFIVVFITSCIQICYYLFKKEKIIYDNNLYKIINIPQMTLISNILLITFFELSSDLSIMKRVHEYEKAKIELLSKYPKYLDKYQFQIDSIGEVLATIELEKNANPENMSSMESAYFKASADLEEAIMNREKDSIKFLDERSKEIEKIDTNIMSTVFNSLSLLEMAETLVKTDFNKEKANINYIERLFSNYEKYLLATLIIWLFWVSSFIVLFFQTRRLNRLAIN